MGNLSTINSPTSRTIESNSLKEQILEALKIAGFKLDTNTADWTAHYNGAKLSDGTHTIRIYPSRDNSQEWILATNLVDDTLNFVRKKLNEILAKKTKTQTVHEILVQFGLIITAHQPNTNVWQDLTYYTIAPPNVH